MKLYLVAVFFVNLYYEAVCSVTCNFDTDLCGWTTNSSLPYKWARMSGQTDDRTSGPINDHTRGDRNGFYIYSGGKHGYNESYPATITSERIVLKKTSAFTFWYDMNGSGIGMLTLLRTGYPQYGTGTVMWQRNKRQGRGWKYAVVFLSAGDFQLIFQSTSRLPFGADIGLDDFKLYTEIADLPTSTTTSPATIRFMVVTKMPSRTRYPSMPLTAAPAAILKQTEGTTAVKYYHCGSLLPGSCNFDTNLCSYSATSKHLGISHFLTWKRHRGKTGIVASIPRDHTTGRGFYMYLTTEHIYSGYGAVTLTSVPVGVSSTICISFAYIMPYHKIVTLSLLMKNGMSRHLIKEFKNSNLKSWKTERLSIHVESSSQIMFESSYVSVYGLVGIDDIKITKGNCGPCVESTTHSTVTTTSMSTTSQTSTSKSTHPTTIGKSTLRVTQKPSASLLPNITKISSSYFSTEKTTSPQSTNSTTLGENIATTQRPFKTSTRNTITVPSGAPHTDFTTHSTVPTTSMSTMSTTSYKSTSKSTQLTTTIMTSSVNSSSLVSQTTSASPLPNTTHNVTTFKIMTTPFQHPTGTNSKSVFTESTTVTTNTPSTRLTKTTINIQPNSNSASSVTSKITQTTQKPKTTFQSTSGKITHATTFKMNTVGTKLFSKSNKYSTMTTQTSPSHFSTEETTSSQSTNSTTSRENNTTTQRLFKTSTRNTITVPSDTSHGYPFTTSKQRLSSIQTSISTPSTENVNAEGQLSKTSIIAVSVVSSIVGAGMLLFLVYLITRLCKNDRDKNLDDVPRGQTLASVVSLKQEFYNETFYTDITKL